MDYADSWNGPGVLTLKLFAPGDNLRIEFVDFGEFIGVGGVIRRDFRLSALALGFNNLPVRTHGGFEQFFVVKFQFVRIELG
jgi:hypothetical protein